MWQCVVSALCGHTEIMGEVSLLESVILSMTVQEAITKSISKNEIVFLSWDEEKLKELKDLCFDYAVNLDWFEFWGDSDAGEEWKVTMWKLDRLDDTAIDPMGL